LLNLLVLVLLQVLRVVAHDDKGQQLGPWQVPLDPPVLLAGELGGV
jgi:hypothetical protein